MTMTGIRHVCSFSFSARVRAIPSSDPCLENSCDHDRHGVSPRERERRSRILAHRDIDSGRPQVRGVHVALVRKRIDEKDKGPIVHRDTDCETGVASTCRMRFSDSRSGSSADGSPVANAAVSDAPR